MNAIVHTPIKFGAGLVACLFIAVALLLFAPATPAHAQDVYPNVKVVDRTVKLDTTTASITVPVTLTTSANNISSVSFVLDYDQSCVRINNVITDVTGLPSVDDYSHRVVNDPDSGELEVAIWDQVGEQTALPTGNLMEVEFALEAACRTGADQSIDFGFTIVPSYTFGSLTGSVVAGAAYTGTYTLNINQNPSAITFTPINVAVTENVPLDREIGTLGAATDAEGDPLTFGLTTGCSIAYANDGFSIAANEPTKLRTSRTFNFEAEDEYPVCVLANDDRGGTYSNVITVTVLPANDAPTFFDLSANTLLEGTANGTEEIGAFDTEDEDSGETFTYTFIPDEVTGDNAYFEIADEKLKAKSDTTYDYDTKAIYKITVQSTDGEATPIQRQFTIQIIGKSVLILPGEPDVPSVVAGSTVTVPIRYNAMGNDVVTATFAINYSDTCLTYNGLSGLQSTFANVGEVDINNNTPITVSIASSTGVLREGVIGYLSFTGGACGTNQIGDWTNLAFGTTTLKAAGEASVTSATSAGKLVVVPNDIRGDCNSDDTLNAGDFSAIALENFDTGEDNGANPALPTKSWLWSPLGSYHGSARGCDANADRLIEVSDIVCAARTYFNATCTLSEEGRSRSAQVAAPASLVAVPGSEVMAPVILTANGNAIAAAAFTVQIDPDLVFDPTDADEDGVPDAVSFNTPAGFFKMVLYDAQQRRLQVLVTGLTMPLPVLSDGAFATIHLQGAATATGGAVAFNLTDLSLGDTEGGAVEATVAPLGLFNRVFLPSVVR